MSEKTDINEILKDTTEQINEYYKGVQAEGHDPLRMATASMMNDKMLHDTATEEAVNLKGRTGNMKVPSAKELKKMQEWAFKYKRKHRLATMEEVTRAVSKHFNLLIIPDESNSNSQTNTRGIS